MIKAIHYASNEVIELSFDQGSISRIDQIEDKDIDRHGLPFAAPGLVELQINGYMNHDFNRLPIEEKTVIEFVQHMWSQGITACYPTIITNSSEAIIEAVTTIREACDHHPEAGAMIAGIHLEGPFISPEPGALGAHEIAHVQAPDWELFCKWQAAAGGKIKIITLSPEWAESTSFIEQCAASGVLVSIGHTSASSEQIAQAVAAGAKMSTHLGNATHLMLPRHPNYMWEQLAQDELWTCAIADGYHLPDQVLKVIKKVKGNRMILVSDAVALSGMPPGAYNTPVGGQVVLTREGKLHLAEQPALLAGSVQMLTDGIAHMIRHGLAEQAEAWNMASAHPAKLMGLAASAGLKEGAPADVVLFHRSADGLIDIQQTYKQGRCMFG